MIFSIDTIKDAQTKKNIVSESFYNDTPDSWFEQTLSMVLDESKIFEYNISSISEGIVGDIIFNKTKDKIKTINFETILSKIFEWFVAAINKLFKSFLSFLLNFVNKDAQLKMMKNKLSNFRGSVRYNKDYYIYRNLETDSSYTSYQNEIERVYDSLILSMSYLSNCKSLTDIENFLNKLREDNIYSVDEMNLLRGRVLGKNDPVESSEFARELFKYFRTTELPIKANVGLFEKNIDGNRVYEAYENYFSSSKQEKMIKKDYTKMKFDAEKEKIKLKTLKIGDYIADDLKLSSELKQIYNNIIMDGCRKIKEICNIYSLLFSAKLDALKEYNLMNREILLAACKEIVKEG